MDSNSSFISIKFDKSHLSSIGERLYTQSLDLIRELVANAYDADATKVNIIIENDIVIFQDNGQGMNKENLEQYFTIGSSFKKENPVSPRFKRVRIGEFGIGKFAVLSLCDRFELYTNNGSYAATVIFDRSDFEKRDDWQIPIIEHKVGDINKIGTRVTLYQVKKQIQLPDLERYLTNIFPLDDKNFKILMNDRQLEKKYVAGERFKLKENTKYGFINGEIIISSLAIPKDQMGVAVRVKGVVIKREYFGLGEGTISTRRMTGEVRADFLPITTDRSNFIKDSLEYELFFQIISKKLKKIIKFLEKQSLSYQDKKSERILSDVLLMIRDALKKNNDIFMTGDLPLFNKKKANSYINPEVTDGTIGVALTKKKRNVEQAKEFNIKSLVKEAVRHLKPKLRGRVKTLLRDERRIVKKIKLGGSELLVSFSHLGSEEKESFVDGGIVFINRDHSLYKAIEHKGDLSYYHLLRLVSQELIKFTYPKNLELAFDWQGRLMADAYQGIKKLKTPEKIDKIELSSLPAGRY